MIKALMLIFASARTWERIAQARRNWIVILLFNLVPLWLIAGLAESYGLCHWGKPQGAISQIKTYSHSSALLFEILQLILMLVIVLVGAKLVKALGDTFHGRHTFNQAFTVTAYGLGPLFLMRILDMFPSVSYVLYWVTWLIGMCLCIGALYHGIPLVMQPDPPQAFGVYVGSSVLLTLVSGLVRFLTFWYLSGNFGKLDDLMAQIVDRVPWLQHLDHVQFLK
jgi:hypothetical protein